MNLKETLEHFAHMAVVMDDPHWSEGSFAYDIAHKLWLGAKAGQAEIAGLTAQLAKAEKDLIATKAITEGAQNRRRDEIALNEKLHAQLAEARATIAELEAKGRARARELITWIGHSVGPNDGMFANLAAKRKIEELKKEMGE